MAQNSNIQVGYFTNTDAVPVNFRNTQILYSPPRNLFAVINANNEPISSFGPEYYVLFNEMGVILFNEGVQEYLASIMQPLTPEEARAVLEQQIQESAKEQQNQSRNNKRRTRNRTDKQSDNNDNFNQNLNISGESFNIDANVDTNNEPGAPATSFYDAKKEKKPETVQKDPTRRLLTFFITTLVVTIVIILIRLYAIPLIQNAQGILS